MKWFLDMLKNYSTFSGRAHRPAYWWAFLTLLLIFIPLAIVDAVTGTLSESAGVGVLSGIFLLAMAIPSMALAARRLHDTGLSGWWQLLNVIPYIGAIAVLVLLARKGTPGPNKYGEPSAA